MKVNTSYLVLTVVIFVVYFGDTTSYIYEKINHKIIGETSRSLDTGNSLFVIPIISTEDSTKLQNKVRKLVRRASDKPANKTYGTEKELETDATANDNSTVIKITGDNPLVKTDIPITPDISDQSKINPLPLFPKAPENCSKKAAETCENKCSNETRFVAGDREYIPLCGCDTLCNDIFMDCCSDYAEHCSGSTVVSSEPVYKARSYIQCETKLDLLLKPCKGPQGVWMIKRCPPHWSDDVIRDKCEVPAIVLNNRTYDTLIPVYSGVNRLTYRNQYCAMCHNIRSYEFWELEFWQSAIPPSHFNKNSLVEFLGLNVEHFKGIKPKSSFYLRYCYFPNTVNTCPNSGDLENTQCVNGTVEIVYSNEGVFYRNKACSSCHGVKTPCSVVKISAGICFVLLGVVSRAVDLQDYGVTMVTKVCSKGQVYDPYISKCRASYQPVVFNSSGDVYRITLSVLKYSFTPSVNKSRLRETIASSFNFTNRQVRRIELATLYDKFIITFTLHLTPLQSLIISFSNTNVGNVKLWKLLRFQNAFPLILNNGGSLTVFRVQVRRLACIHSKAYRYHEYTIFEDRRLLINKTGVTYEPYEYELSGSDIKRKATVCLKLAPFRLNGSYISLNRSEYILLPNLTLLYKTRRYDFGEYSFYNGTVYIFVGFSREHKESSYLVELGLGLTVVNFVGFVLSEVFLIVLIATYILFKELRNLPGKNLLSLAISLSLADLLWLLALEFTQSEELCTVLAIATHYFYIVYFTACSVVAYHSCQVFCRNISIRPRPNEENRRFVIYLLVTWAAPAFFIALCIILDQTGSYAVNYGPKEQAVCFLGTEQAQIYLFVLPIGVFLLFNIAVFVHVAKRLWKNQKSNSQFLSSELQRKRDRENVFICARLSTLMGFSWLFIFLHFLFSSRTEAFLYLFVLFASLQGVFVGTAFLVNRKCLALYRDLIQSKWNSKSKNTSATVNSATTMYQDTRM